MVNAKSDQCHILIGDHLPDGLARGGVHLDEVERQQDILNNE
jgi:hypothetical protein